MKYTKDYSASLNYPIYLRVLRYINSREAEFSAKMKSCVALHGDKILVPFVIEDVIDCLLWNIAEQRFDKIILTMNDSPNATKYLLYKDSVETDKIKRIELDVEEE